MHQGRDIPRCNGRAGGCCEPAVAGGVQSPAEEGALEEASAEGACGLGLATHLRAIAGSPFTAANQESRSISLLQAAKEIERQKKIIDDYARICKSMSRDLSAAKIDAATQDNINHPAHYTATAVEPINVIEEWQLGFHLGNCVKYLARCELKGKPIEDLEKARWYLDREIHRRKVARG